MNLDSLPRVLLGHVVLHLPPSDVFSLRSLSRKFLDVVKSLNVYWFRWVVLLELSLDREHKWGIYRHRIERKVHSIKERVCFPETIWWFRIFEKI